MSLAQQPQRDQFRQDQSDKQGKARQKRDGIDWKDALTVDEQEAKATVKTLSGFWKKASNDWIFNLSAMLAYNLLMTIIPILAMLLSIFGLVLGSLSPATEQQFINSITNGLPGGQTLIQAALKRLAQSSGLFAVITIIVSAWFGSRLFITIEQCFGIIYRLPTRKFIRQNAIALSMMLIFVVLIPILLVVSSAPSFLSSAVVDKLLPNATATRIWLAVATAIAGFIVASALFLVIYSVVPNRPLRIQDAWRGALIAGLLLEIYDVAFPFYASHFLKPNSYGSTAGFAVLVLVFFYYFGFILLLGAEMNSYWAGQRATTTDLPGIMYETQVQKTTQGAAGPTAGKSQENLQADQTGLNLTMTPAEDVLKPPGPSEKQLEKEQRKEQEKQRQEEKASS
jgi:membrane protein